MDDRTTLVYRLTYTTAGQEISPGHVWGTVEAISSLGRCTPVYSTVREVPRELLDAHGFLFDQPQAAAAD